MIKAVIKLILLLLVIVLAIILLAIAKKAGKRQWQQRISNTSFAIVSFIIGLKISVEGEVSVVRPLMLVSNHISYLDILILGAKTPVVFTPKSEIEQWPIVSTACKLVNAIFIHRRVDKIKESKEKIEHMLASSEVISLFPEGTTGNGRHLLPFKSSLFSIAEQEINMYNGTGTHELFIQPAVINYTALGSLPIDSTQWPMIAWYGDMDLMPHLWQILKLTRIDAKLTLLPPVTLEEIGNRKKLAHYLREKTVEVLQER